MALMVRYFQAVACRRRESGIKRRIQVNLSSGAVDIESPQKFSTRLMDATHSHFRIIA